MGSRVALIALLGLTVGACFSTKTGSKDDDGCQAGAFGCACEADMTCDPGLTCLQDVCIPEDGGTDGTDSASASATATDTTSASGTASTDPSTTGATTGVTVATTTDGTTGVDPTGGALTEHHVFVTSTVYASAFGGLAMADTACAQRAAAAALPGTWIALLNDDQTEVADRITLVGPIYNMAEELVAMNEDELYGGTAQNPVVYDEEGQDVGDGWAWIGGGGDSCDNWTSAAEFTYGRYAIPAQADSWFWGEGVTDCFGVEAHLYCIDQ